MPLRPKRIAGNDVDGNHRLGYGTLARAATDHGDLIQLEGKLDQMHIEPDRSAVRDENLREFRTIPEEAHLNEIRAGRNALDPVKPVRVRTVAPVDIRQDHLGIGQRRIRIRGAHGPFKRALRPYRQGHKKRQGDQCLPISVSHGRIPFAGWE